MNTIRQTFAALRALIIYTVILGVIFPLVLVAIGRLMPHQADGSLIVMDGKVVGSELLGQLNEGAEWFQPRPSTSDYAGDSSGGSNLSPTAEDLKAAMEERRDALLKDNPDAPGPIPEEALTASSSGLDPHISPEYARWQLPRVAKARNMSTDELQQLIDDNTSHALWGFFGVDSVNVTKLNVALAQMKR